MKKLSKIKLTNLSQEDLADREMNALRGGILVDVLVLKEQNLKLLTIVLM
ncbi:TIGR04149 family rSAM-modified RiPP [Bacteroides fragilis]